MGELPSYRPATRGDLVRFDLTTGLGAAVGALKRNLGPLQVTRVLMRFAWVSLRDPLGDVADTTWPADQEALVRHQLRSALWLESAIGGVVADTDRAREILGEVIAATGGRFIERMLPLPEPHAWHEAPNAERSRFMTEATGRFFNAEVSALHTDDEVLGFDVGRCRFVELCAEIGKPWLAELFCAADSVFFGEASSPVHLSRTSTLASGGTRCDFRFRFREP